MKATTNITGSGTNAQTFEESLCSSVWVGEFKQQSISFSEINILLFTTAILGNSLILVALHKESSLHSPSKLLYRCLATTDLLVGLVTQPLYTTYWMSLVHEHWSLCQYARDAVYVSSYALCSVSLLTLTAISVDRLLAMLLGLRYKEIVTLRRTYIILARYRLGWMSSRWFILLSQLPYSSLVLHHNHTIWSGNLSRLVHKDFSRSQLSSGSNTRSCSTTAEPTKCTEHGAIQKGSVQCTVGAVSISCLLCTKHDSGNCDIFEFKGIIEFHRNQGNGKCLSVL